MDKKLKADLFMFFSFVLLSVLVYIFHIIQSAGHIRGYITGLALLIGWFIIQRERDRRLRNLWGSFILWVIHSNVYFDVRTHYVGIFRFIKHIFFCVLVFYLHVTRNPITENNREAKTTTRLSSFRNVVIILIYIYIALFPDISTNAYGNAIFSILRVFCSTILVMTRYKDEHNVTKIVSTRSLVLHEFAWVFFVHDFALLPLTIWQLVSDIVTIKYSKTFPYIKITAMQNNSYPTSSQDNIMDLQHGKQQTRMEKGTCRNDVITMSEDKISRLFRNK